MNAYARRANSGGAWFRPRRPLQRDAAQNEQSVLNHRMLGAGSSRQCAISMRMTYGGQRQRKHEPTTARNTPNPSFAAGSCDALVPRNSPAKPCSSQGFANSRWRDSHQTGGDDSRKRQTAALAIATSNELSRQDATRRRRV